MKASTIFIKPNREVPNIVIASCLFNPATLLVSAVLAVGGVRLSVCLSHSCIVSKRLQTWDFLSTWKPHHSSFWAKVLLHKSKSPRESPRRAIK